MSAAAPGAHFIEGSRGRICVVARRPLAPAGRALLVVPPFAEEMNKTRRMLTEVALALQPRGIATLIADLHGTGDSQGEFRDASCSAWALDLARTAAWSAASGWPVAGLLCVRFGCLLGAQLAGALAPALQRSVFWQPVIDGDGFLTQFLRLRAAASMMGGSRESVRDLRARLRDGGCLEVAGYELSAELARGMGQLRLAALMGPALGELTWLEVVRDAPGSVTAASVSCIEAGRSRGLKASVATLAGEPFWGSTEIVRNGALVDATVAALTPLGAAP